MNKQLLRIISIVVTIAIVLTGCGHAQVQKEADKYSMKAYADGVLRAQAQGKGLNGRFLGEMRRSFAGQGIKLTHEMFAEDGRGNVSYQYIIAGKPAHNVTLHVFSDQAERENRIKSWYGDQGPAETPTTKTEIYSKANAALVYTSMGKEKGKYSKKVKSLFRGLLDRISLQQNIPPEQLKKLHMGLSL